MDNQYYWNRSHARFMARARLKALGLDQDLFSLFKVKDLFDLDKLQEEGGNVCNLLDALAGPNCLTIYKALIASQPDEILRLR